MGTKDTGGPAFPIPLNPGEGYKIYQYGDGMTLRDYFMAHAPAVPQQWFIPNMPPCPVVPSAMSLPFGELRDELLNGDDWKTQEASDWLVERDRIEVLQSDWQIEFRKQLCVQWPAAWADAMLEQRQC